MCNFYLVVVIYWPISWLVVVFVVWAILGPKFHTKSFNTLCKRKYFDPVRSSSIKPTNEHQQIQGSAHNIFTLAASLSTTQRIKVIDLYLQRKRVEEAIENSRKSNTTLSRGFSLCKTNTRLRKGKARGMDIQPRFRSPLIGPRMGYITKTTTNQKMGQYITTKPKHNWAKLTWTMDHEQP